MTRTEYANKLREAGFQVRPLWQGKTEDSEGPRFDLTCYAIYTRDHIWITNMIARQTADDGVLVFFESPNLHTVDDIRTLRQIAERGHAAA